MRADFYKWSWMCVLGIMPNVVLADCSEVTMAQPINNSVLYDGNNLINTTTGQTAQVRVVSNAGDEVTATPAQNLVLSNTQDSSQQIIVSRWQLGLSSPLSFASTNTPIDIGAIPPNNTQMVFNFGPDFTGATVTPNNARAGTYTGAVLLNVLCQSGNSAASPIVLSVTAMVTLSKPITIIPQPGRPLDFGAVFVQDTAETTVVQPTDLGAAVFKVQGNEAGAVIITVPTSSVTLTDAKGDTLLVDAFTIANNGIVISTGQATLDNTGVLNNITVGATLHVPANVPPGNYIGTGQLQVVYGM